jgi:hypothetical protein
MGHRRFNHRRVKIHRNYTIDEIARLLPAHTNTVRLWLRQGLPVIDQRRPALIMGRDRHAFLDRRRKQLKQTCRAGEMYCLKCRVPKEPAGAMADYVPLTVKSGNLRGIGPDCHKLIHRRVSLPKLESVRGNLDISFPHQDPHIRESASPSLHCDFDKEQETDANA